jgi:hypothetical protein
MVAPAHRFLSRGPGVPRPEDELLLALVPPGVSVPYQYVYDELVALRQAEVLDWFTVTPDIWGWALMSTRTSSVSIEMANAISRRVLVCSTVVEDVPERLSLFAVLCRALRRLFGRAGGPVQTAAPSPSRVVCEVSAILDALDF